MIKESIRKASPPSLLLSNSESFHSCWVNDQNARPSKTLNFQRRTFTDALSGAFRQCLNFLFPEFFQQLEYFKVTRLFF